MQPVEDVLAKHPFFEGLAPKYLAALAEMAENRHYESEEFLFREGERSDEFHVILHGKVALETFGPDRGSIIIATVGEDEVLGWTWIVEPYIHTYDAQALVFTRVVTLNGRLLRELCEQDHTLGYELMKRFAQVMARRLESTRMQLIDIYGIPLPRRRL